MLIEFQVGNFLSFKDTVTFSMVASEINSEDSEIDENNVFSVGKDFKLVKTAAIYGANASGKSNLAEAFYFMQYFVINSSKMLQITDLINVEPFRLNTETEIQPSFFQVIFLLNKRTYRYGFEVSKEKVTKEWLYCITKIEEYRMFERIEQRIQVDDIFKEGIDLESRTRLNSLFLSVSAQFNGTISIHILKWFASFQVIFGRRQEELLYKVTLQCLRSPQMKQEIYHLIKDLDISIQNLEISEDEISTEKFFGSFPDEVKSLFSNSLLKEHFIQTSHKKYNKNGKFIGLEIFDLEKNESEGTRKLLHLLCLFLNTFKNRQILIIDELDTRLHPLITHKLIQLFSSNRYNPKFAQLIFTTHDINLLNPTLFGSRLFRRDQIWFTEKNSMGATDLYSLVEYDISEDRDFELDYIRGRYGAIPLISTLVKLLSD